ncbi:1-deoxy-D-xylulose-5-phosphate reductoisomerase [Planctopirus hydrillae]|uniref:1-deoxy-D-xylulose 5-phosphate reductoisomerase n=1 Tax=Planctopirus hydrillae TaxID=1841610 RepID=A0A1C3E9N7_9PLAN|nr:1-deoxy-D-xylulose-5-phosphate reductoisomerase [Planctopirus hydrillae]ODA29941.1 1-deoxy-D-xylulose-5-phosphate reductoisomerase [Planctopirus hydrillae]
MKQIALLGSTGSIGLSTLDVVRSDPASFQLFALAAHRRVQELASQCHEFHPRYAVIADSSLAREIDRSLFPPETQLLIGEAGIEQVATDPEVGIVVSAIVGAAGLKGTWAAAQSGKRVALANKESLVVAGALVTNAAKASGGEILPVDSEHSAIFQCLAAGNRHEVARIHLTASGGPFRKASLAELAQVTVAAALDHPTWKMGPKITIDSATMMNKALEVIEARWLFDASVDELNVVVHPQSIIHSLVEYVDGSILAQLSPPDMRLPIQYALSWPQRKPGFARKMNWFESQTMEFFPPDFERFPALKLGFEVAAAGGGSGAVLNAANEVAVERFLNNDLKFMEIPQVCGEVLAAHTHSTNPSLSELLALDAWAREETRRWKA